MTKYLVTEIQTATDGTVSNITTSFDDQLQAESAYHSVLAAAAISQLKQHTAILYTHRGNMIMSGTYCHIPDEE